MVKQMDAPIHTTNKAIAETARQNEPLTAQLTGVWANVENAANIVRSDIMDLRACLIPELHNASASLLTEVRTLQGKLSTLSSATAGSIPPPAPPTNPTFEAADATTQVTPPLPHAPGVSFPPPDTSPRFNSSWYHNAQHPRHNDPATKGSFGAPNRDSGMHRSDTFNINMSAYATNSPFMGGHITLPRSTDIECQA